MMGKFMQQRKRKGVDCSKQRAEIWVPPASSTSHWGIRLNRANLANFHRSLTTIINSTRRLHGPPLDPNLEHHGDYITIHRCPKEPRKPRTRTPPIIPNIVTESKSFLISQR